MGSPASVTLACFRHNGHHVFYASHLVRRFRAVGLRVRVLGSPEFVRGVQHRTDFDGPATIVPFSSTRPEAEWEKFQKARTAFRVARRDGTDVLHFLNIDGYLPTLRPLLGRRREPAACGTIHWISCVDDDGGGPWSRLKAGIRRRSFRIDLRRGLRTQVHARAFASDLSGRFGTGAVDYVPFPIEFGAPKAWPSPERRRRFRKRHGVGPQDVLVLDFGFTNRYKGPDLVVHAVARLPARYHLLIAGPEGDVSRAELADLGRRAGVSDRLHLDLRMLPTPEVAEAFHAADVVAIPHRSRFSGESGPLTIALASGRPVVCSDHPALRENVEAYGGGRTFPAENVDAMAEALRSVSDRPPAVDVRAFWRDHSPEAFAAAVLRSYERALENR